MSRSTTRGRWALALLGASLVWFYRRGLSSPAGAERAPAGRRDHARRRGGRGFTWRLAAVRVGDRRHDRALGRGRELLPADLRGRRGRRQLRAHPDVRLAGRRGRDADGRAASTQAGGRRRGARARRPARLAAVRGGARDVHRACGGGRGDRRQRLLAARPERPLPRPPAVGLARRRARPGRPPQALRGRRRDRLDRGRRARGSLRGRQLPRRDGARHRRRRPAGAGRLPGRLPQSWRPAAGQLRSPLPRARRPRHDAGRARAGGPGRHGRGLAGDPRADRRGARAARHRQPVPDRQGRDRPDPRRRAAWREGARARLRAVEQRPGRCRAPAPLRRAGRRGRRGVGAPRHGRAREGRGRRRRGQLRHAQPRRLGALPQRGARADREEPRGRGAVRGAAVRAGPRPRETRRACGRDPSASAVLGGGQADVLPLSPAQALRRWPQSRTVSTGKRTSVCGTDVDGGQMNSVLARLLPGHAHADAAAVREQREHQQLEQVTFPDLTWDHFHWERQRRTGSCDNPKAANRYRQTRAAFEARYGQIVGEYWSIVEPSGVALTFKHAPFLLRPFLNDTREFHRSTDWVTRHNPPLADVLFDCENLSIRISEVLRYTSESVGLKRIMAVASHVLGVIDRAGGKVGDAQATQIADEEDRELREIRDYYRRAGVRIGLTVYTQGMVIGLLLMTFLVALVVVPLVLWGSVTWGTPLHEILISAAAGAIGAIVSVLQRMASEKSKFAVHYDLGKRILYMLGSNRPVLGVVFGVFTYFVLASGVLGTSPPTNTNPLYYYGSLAFVAGFSERFTRVLAKSVEGLVPAQGTPADTDTVSGEPTG